MDKETKAVVKKEAMKGKVKATKAARKKAIRHISREQRCSFSVASHILDCMGTQKRKKFLDHFREVTDVG